MSKNNVFRLVKRIQKDSKHSEDYHTGLLGEQIIVSSYNQMPVEKLIKFRYIINKLIHKKKEEKRIIEYNQNLKQEREKNV